MSADRSLRLTAWLALSALVAASAPYVAGGLFLALNRANPLQVHWGSVFDFWRGTEGRPALRRRLVASFAATAVGGAVVAPLLLASAMSTRRPLHGAARFATGAEVRAAGLYARDGILVGRIGGRYLCFGGQQFVQLAAPTRSGKGVGVVIPNCLNWPGSLVVVDIKRENFDVTAGYRAARGQAVYLFAPFDEEGRTARWNPMSYVRTDPALRVGDLLAIGAVLYPSDIRQAGSTDAFFNDQARNLFLGLGLYLLETPSLPRTIGEMLRQSSGKGRLLRDHLTDLIHAREDSEAPLTSTCVDALQRFLATSESTMASIVASFNAPLTIFADPRVDAATGGDDFLLTEVRRRRISIYLHVPFQRLTQGALLLNLFYTQLIELNTKELPEQNPELRVPCLLLMDEFAAMGRIAVIERAAGFMAGYGLRLLTVTQSMAQLSALYGRDGARNLSTNHALQVLFSPREQADANELSEMLGTLTERVASRGVSRAAGRAETTRSVNVTEQRRALLLPQELKELGSEREIVLVENCRPILAEKIIYYRDPAFRQRVLPPPKVLPVDLDGHVARVQRRQPSGFEAEPNYGAPGGVAPSREPLPKLPEHATPEEMAAFVEACFGRVGRVVGPKDDEIADIAAAGAARSGDSSAAARAFQTGER
jgi:type IV secretion system protein VirD4